MDLFRELEKRRRSLGMTRVALAARSQVSLPTVNRILSGDHPTASLASVAAIADALGMKVLTVAESDGETMRQNQANRKAKRLVRSVQGTSALEGQGVDREELNRMVARTTAELLMSNRRLWSE